MKCDKCGENISEKVDEFSRKKFGKPLCFKCQKGDQGSQTEEVNKNDFWRNKEKRDIENQIKISKQWAFNTAVNIVSLKAQHDPKIKQLVETKPTIELVERIESVADRIFSYPQNK